MTKLARSAAMVGLGVIVAYSLLNYGGMGFLLAATTVLFMVVLST